MTPNALQVIEFWFSDRVRRLWFRSTPEFDDEIRLRFEDTWKMVRNGELDSWENDIHGALALIIVLDQFPLNMYRGQGISFSTESKARDIAYRAINRGWDSYLDKAEKTFLYMPLMHSENLADQDRAVALYESAEMTDNLRFATHHREIIRRFGRFPHRNSALGRKSSAEEREWLQSKQAFQG